jgi:hypothetical protein
MSDSIGTTIGSYLGYVSTVLMFGLSIFAMCNHKRIRSHCCGRETVVSIDVEATTPPENKPTLKV